MGGWKKTPAERKAQEAYYTDPVYKRNRAVVVRRAGGRCEDCGHLHKTQCDHIIPRAQGGTHALENLMMRCAGEGTCKCHEAKTAREGNRASKGNSDPDPRPWTDW
jgi:5-methylcytosine-specific restriction endonuclease McrA